MEIQTRKFNKRKRYWICEKCGIVCNRRKSKEYKIHCGQDMRKTRTVGLGFKIQKKRSKKRTLLINKIMDYKNNYTTNIRNAGGQVLKVSKETKQLWKKVNKSKTKPSILKYANLWIKSLEKDARNFKRNDRNWAKSLNNVTGEITKSIGGWSAPSIKYTDKFSSSLHGRFSAGLQLGGVFIEINKTFDMNNIKHTILHETLHYLDSLAKIESGHYCYWDMRLKKMEEIFKVK